MYELIQAGVKTYFINCPAKIGIYKLNNSDVCLIDSGNDKDAGKKVLKILESNNWTLKYILNTHSHADHIGGNNFLQQKTRCEIYICDTEVAFAEHPVLEPSLLYGAYPFKELQNKFLNAAPSNVKKLTPGILPNGLEMLMLNGHAISMSAFKTDDDIWFLGDCLASRQTIEKYHIPYAYNVAEYINSLNAVSNLSAKLFIPSHADATEDIKPLVHVNLQKTEEIIAFLLETCLSPISFDDILKSVFSHYNLIMDFNQYVLVGSTIRAYLAYMHDTFVLSAAFSENKLFWQAV